ncbi:integral membrane protein [Sporothrix brasiliensis 5110]|uniref:Integral membrane protein n=1 Tax=Sporothrix brasiliensis 5110 TaxID=1398154 RepID=A0A0C2FS23_9PEZI|nr:uncharacterized protein SPBR_05964 [Sporothrix brasiliensis 5110]KIH93823.1 integral membrane protein [Sporothrix brasiliensis 5110]
MAVDYPTRSSTVVVANAALIIITGIFFFVRLWVRLVILHQVGLDDVLIWAASLFAFSLALTSILMTKYGMGLHIEDVSASDLESFLILQFVSAVSYVWAFVLIKLSFAVFYLRVIPTTGFRRLNFVIIAILAAQGVEETFVVCFACRPIYKFWRPAVEGTCLNLLNFYYISFGIKLATDLVLFLEPIPTLLRLKLPWVKRVGLIVMFSLGLLTCVISIIRATYLNDTSDDITWRLIDPIDWSTAEVCSLIICACVPYVRNLLAEIPILNEALGLSSNHSKAYPSNYGPRSGHQDNSIALQSQRTYIQSRNYKGAAGGSGGVGGGSNNGLGGVSTLASASANPYGGANNSSHQPHRNRATESTEEIFPNYMDKQGGIVVSTDVKVAVEEGSHQSQARSSYSESR